MDNLIDWFYGQVVGVLGNFFAEMGNMGVELFDLDWVQAIVLFFSQLGWALFGVSLVVCIFECGIDYTTGRANIKDTALNILKGFLSVCLFTLKHPMVQPVGRKRVATIRKARRRASSSHTAGFP